MGQLTPVWDIIFTTSICVTVPYWWNKDTWSWFLKIIILGKYFPFRTMVSSDYFNKSGLQIKVPQAKALGIWDHREYIALVSIKEIHYITHRHPKYPIINSIAITSWNVFLTKINTSYSYKNNIMIVFPLILPTEDYKLECSFVCIFY